MRHFLCGILSAKQQIDAIGEGSSSSVPPYLLKVNSRNTRTRCEICSKLTLKTPERRRRPSSVFIGNFEHILHLVLVFLLLTLNM